MTLRGKLVDFMKSWDEKNTILYGKDKTKLEAARKTAVAEAAKILGIEVPKDTPQNPYGVPPAGKVVRE